VNVTQNEWPATSSLEVHTVSTSPDATATSQRDDRHDDDHGHHAEHGFFYEVDGVTFEHDRPRITGAEIMSAAGIPTSDGIVQLLPDGTTKTVGLNDEVRLVPGAQFKRRPRFKRG
jgi:hypothetical protein